MGTKALFDQDFFTNIVLQFFLQSKGIDYKGNYISLCRILNLMDGFGNGQGGVLGQGPGTSSDGGPGGSLGDEWYMQGGAPNF